MIGLLAAKLRWPNALVFVKQRHHELQNGDDDGLQDRR